MNGESEEIVMATLEILLREDVDRLGRRGEIVRVKAGFARNYLLPRGLAMTATSASVKAIQQERQVLQKREARERTIAQSLGEKLQGISLQFERKTGDQGIFYGSVTTHDIAEALAERGLEIERRRIHLETPIKQAGTYAVSVKLHHDIVVDVPVTVKREGEEETEASSEPVASTQAPSEPSDAGPVDADPVVEPEMASDSNQDEEEA